MVYPLILVNVNQYDCGSINFSAPALVAGLRQRASDRPRCNERFWPAVKFAAKNSENSDARDWARAVRRDDLCSWAQFPRETAVPSCCFVGKLFLRWLEVAFAAFGVIAPPANSGTSGSPAAILMPGSLVFVETSHSSVRVILIGIFGRRGGCPGQEEAVDSEAQTDKQIAAERRFRLAVEAAPNAMVMIDGTGAIIMVNAQTERVFGYSRAELLGQPVEMLVPGRFRGHHSGLRDAFLAEPRARPMGAGRDLYGLRKDGTEFPVEIGLNPIATDEGPMVLSAIIDITERRTAELALRDSAQRLRSLAAIVESSDDAIISTTLDGTVTSWNKAAERIFGYAAGEMIGHPILRLATPGHGDDMLEILNRIKRGERVDHHETVRQHKNGAVVHVSLSVSPVFDTDGRLIGASKIARDITAAKAAEAALQEAQARSQELHAQLLHVSRLSAMGEMAAVLAHELNQPLTAIGNYLGAAGALLDQNRDLPLARIRTAVARAGEQAIRAGEIIQQLRRFMSRSDGEKRIEAVSPLVRDAAELALVGTKQRGLNIIAQNGSEDVTIIADRIQIQQVLLNLLRNAAEAVADQEQQEIRLVTELRNDSVEISVIDNGPGLPEEVQAKLFQPFVSTKATGMGLGLSICRTIVAGHNGCLSTEPNPAGGTIFRLSLPSAPPGDQVDG
jgi:two-component system sensor kinase FixL